MRKTSEGIKRCPTYKNTKWPSEVKLIIKWGCDGSSGLSEYKQNFKKPEDKDASVFSMYLVPLFVVAKDDEKRLIWENLTPSSTRFCGLVKFIFAKESEKLIKDECLQMESLISALTEANVSGTKFTFEFHPTMIDGKVCNAIVGNRRTSTCYVCGSTTEYLNMVPAKPKEQWHLRYGIGNLHLWINSLNFFLQIAYRIDIASAEDTHVKNKAVIKVRKAEIQTELKKVLGITVDKPMFNYGSSNDGNTAKKFFKNFKKTSECTGLDADILEHFYVMITAISTKGKVNAANLADYDEETRSLMHVTYP